MLSQPPDAPVDPGFLAGLVGAAAIDPVADGAGVARLHPVGGDHQRGDAGAGHASRAGSTELVAPRAVEVLGFLPMPLGQNPGAGIGRHADPFRLVQGQQRELRVGVVAVAHAGIRPRPLVIPFGNLRALQPFHVAVQQRPVLVRRGAGEDHRLQGDDVGPLGPDLAEMIEGLLHRRVVRLDAGVQQGQGHQGADAAGHAEHVGPGAVGLLLPLEIAHASVDRLADLLGGDFRPHGRYDQSDQGDRNRRDGAEWQRRLPTFLFSSPGVYACGSEAKAAILFFFSPL